ncbi:MAG TPA: hypothetical protein VJ521_01865, partial [Acidobacteriota bacterium]|nr:hypothetical protein [Acidobacteriota bacterium]
KNALAEDHFQKALDSDRPGSAAVSGTPPLEADSNGKGMKASNGNRTNCATDVLYRLSKIMCATATGERANWAEYFASYQQKRVPHPGEHFKVEKVDSKRLHVYSHHALRTYPFTAVLRDFVETRSNCWTKHFLAQGLSNERTLSELRVLAVFGYVIGEPFTAWHGRLNVRQSVGLLKAEIAALGDICSCPQLTAITRERLSAVWSCCEANFATTVDQLVLDSKARLRNTLWQRLQPVFGNWDQLDDRLFALGARAAIAELQKVGSDYLQGGALEALPGEIGDMIAHNLTCERHFAQFKVRDTRASHHGVNYLEGLLLYNQLVMNAPSSSALPSLSSEQWQTVRQEARRLPSAKQNEAEAALEAEQKKQKDDELAAAKQQRARQRQERLTAELQGKQCSSDIDQIKRMGKKDLQLQLRLHQRRLAATGSTARIVLGGKKEELRERVVGLVRQLQPAEAAVK